MDIMHSRGEARRRGGFTLIEMLAVISIMMILASLILVGLNVARERASVLRARRDVAQLITAWTAYYSDYHRFPTVDSIAGNSLDGSQIVTGRDVVQILRGRENHNGQNTRQIPYMDFHQNTSGFPDPWGRLYRIVWDVPPYDGQVSVMGETLRISLAAWSAGKDGDDGTKDDVRSWRSE